MAVFKCKMCGGALEVDAGQTVAVCEYCDTKQTLPRLDDERRTNLYDRAGHFRRNNEYDKAIGIYEQILTEDATDAEAYWSLVLCRYGIEYVEDPATRKRVPTVNRAQFTSILADENYKSALQYADPLQRDVYESEAHAIEEIQKGILAISQKEDPFDVFICYKETDANGRRTQDSVLANDLYHQLKGEGYKVFFARITLEDKLGSAYEPYIFAALNSAKVMVVLGTKAEYFNAVWVKNEWSRYLSLIRGGAKKMLIPAYRDMDPYELPEEFSHLQAQDMSKLGFMQDLIRGIKKIIGGETAQAAKNNPAVVYGGDSPERLLKNAQTYLKLNNLPSALETYTTVTRDYPEDHRGWWGLIICETENFTKCLLDQSQLNVWFGYVRQLAEEKDFAPLQQTYVEYLRKISDFAAIEEIKSVNELIRKYERIKETEKDQIHTLQNELKMLERDYIAQQKADARSMESWDENIEMLESNITKWYVKLSIALGCFAWGLTMMFVDQIWFGVIIMIIGVVFCNSLSANGTKRELDSRLDNAKYSKQFSHQTRGENAEVYQKNVDVCNRNIARQNEKIRAVQDKIVLCQRYLELGKDKISTYCFAEICAACGVEQSVDPLILEYREAVFPKKTAPVKETITLHCPFCDGNTVVEKDLAYKKGVVACKHCGNRMQVEKPSEAVAEPKEEPIQEIVCPSCHQAFQVDKRECEGHCFCPGCGVSIGL